MGTEIIFVRHGETAGNLDGRLHGRTDLPLTERGRLQAQRVAERLAGLTDIGALYSSPLQRARATAETIGRRLSLTPTLHDDLMELNFGDMEGHTLQELQQKHPDLYARLMDSRDLDAGFPNGETRREFHARVARALDALRELYAGSRLVIVSHLMVIGSGLAQLLTGDPNRWDEFLVANCSVTHLEIAPSGAVALHCWNDISHLDQTTEATGWTLPS
ncbi:histidine phosphatase family protein [Sphaerobacter thermophilus]|uniref:Phosphoglycerate mutase n=1 Tax=Sphaerobacter thermophilus (strain ATCC 49802 / DSM 20745 / KCCM 41009 / NCIMB 13125 / S 6022) TaxID=479434 RepID=D1C2P1_SPHTD|nr:histidine phosphatase family protein [Sphaerobacter thermophilus]ACZ38508.1 Phosphoglycerate mutase [Sphaerobacter thermophilus DSM 20745]